MNELLVDTNILVYAIDEDSEFFAKSRFILSKTDCQLCTTSKNFAEFLAVTTRGQNSLSMGDALEVIEDYLSLLTVLFPNDHSFEVFRELLSKYQPAGLKVHDFEIISIALAHRPESFRRLSWCDSSVWSCMVPP
ncbi:MAG: type II toxin-antitoxin system VapC family toxin [bacterium]